MKISRLRTITGPARSIELRFTPTGRAVATVYFDDDTKAEAWDQVAENLATLADGTIITVTGVMKSRTWKDREDKPHTQEYLSIQLWGRV